MNEEKLEKIIKHNDYALSEMIFWGMTTIASTVQLTTKDAGIMPALFLIASVSLLIYNKHFVLNKVEEK